MIRRYMIVMLAITVCITFVNVHVYYIGQANTMRGQPQGCTIELRYPAFNIVASSTTTTKTATAIKRIPKASTNTTSTTNTTTKPIEKAASALMNETRDCFFDYGKVMPIVDVNTTIPTWTQLNSQFPMLSKGGHYKPTHCRPKHHLSIIIPYRNRENHLKLFLQHMHPFLQAQMHEYTIYVVELEKDVIFKKGLLMNAGFIEVSKQAESECFIFHDIDMLPMNAGIDYTCRQGTVIHPTFYVRQYNFSVRNFKWYLGGALSFNKFDFRRVNGFSNLYWGWGGEDDDMHRRLDKLRIKIERPKQDRLRFESWAHTREEEFINRAAFIKTAVERMHEEGLNSANYTILRTEQRPLYTWIYVSANQTEGSYKDLVQKHGPNSKDKLKGRGRVLPPQ